MRMSPFILLTALALIAAPVAPALAYSFTVLA